MVDATADAPYVDVVVDVPTDKPGDTFTYRAPTGFALHVGHQVRVPFGQRVIGGVVVGHRWETGLGYTKSVSELVHSEPVLSESQLDLARWVSDYYAAPLFESIAPMLPPGHRGRSTAIIQLRENTEPPANLPKGSATLLAYLRSNPRPYRAATLTKRLGPWVPNALLVLERANLLLDRWAPAPRSPARPTHRTSKGVRLAVAPESALIWANRHGRRAPEQARLAVTLAESARPYAAIQVRRHFGASVITALVDRGIAELTEIAIPASVGDRVAEPTLLPTSQQADALDAIRFGLDKDSAPGRSFLLQGATGSGKTEVYLQAIAHVLSLRKRAIVLVPELSLTPQTLERFEARFPGQVVALHSGLTPAQQWDTWWRVLRGKADVVIGSRGAVFAPQANLGLIVVDEEHEWTYKQQDSNPRYHARDVALKLAELTGCTVVMGSATPDLVTAHRAETGRHVKLLLPDRIDASGVPLPLARVTLVDMRDELRQGNRGVFSTQLKAALAETFASGKQSLLFLNRRGTASVIKCRSCGHGVRCYRCGTAYTYHAAQGLICHQCNNRRTVPKICPRCRSPHIRSLGLGTQRLVDEVEALLPGARTLRWDRDSASTARAHAELLANFTAGEADVLVGTQMIAKGLHLPDVTLVGIVLADIGLHVTDFRAAERTFQTLTQVSGRAGRGDEPGRVIVQTYTPEHYAVQTASRQNYQEFYDEELARRHALDLPPFSRLLTMTISNTREALARQEAQRMAARLRATARAWDVGVRIIGPAPSYPPRLRGAWRWHLTLRGSDPRLLLDKMSLPPAWIVNADPA